MRRSLLMLACALLIPRCGGATDLPGSIASDSLLMPSECYVISREDLIERNVHTLDDILQLLPGVALWREGPHGAHGGFSIDGRDHRGVNLLVNGIPVVDHYAMEALTRFLPLSRLLRVELVFSGSPCFSGDLSSQGFINLVLEEGGREGPVSEVNFTYGNANRRARRAWFATPRSYLSAALAYDEYLQDGIEAYPAIQHRLLGKDDMRSVLAEVAMRTSVGDDVLFRLQRYEDSYNGTWYDESEDVRRSGFGSELLYRRAGFSGHVTQRVLELARLSGRVLERALGGGVRWKGAIAELETRVFASAERVEFQNDIWGAYFDPSYYRVETGAVLGGRFPSRVTWRLGAYGGDHSVVGRYGSAEVGIAKAWSDRFSQDVIIARRLRIPSAEELFQPALSRTISGESYATMGNADLSPAVADELSLGFRFSRASLSIFGRNERRLIALSETSPAVYRSEGSGAVAGIRARFSGGAKVLGVDCSLTLGVEGYPEREALASGVPRYRAVGEARLQRRIFSGTELISLKLDSELAGKREWNGGMLPEYHVHNVAASLSIMSTRLSFEYRNILNEQYETVPGYTMPPRHYRIGVFWELFD